MSGVLINGKIWTQTYAKGEWHVKLKAEIYQAKSNKGYQQTIKRREETLNGFPVRASEGTNPAGVMILHIQTPEL